MRQPVSLLILAVVLFQAITTSAQNQALKFEVTSVKPNMTGRGGLEDVPPTGRVSFTGVTFRTLMNAAYRVQAFQIIGGPAWLAVDRFDVQASPPPDFHPEPVKPCFVALCPETPVQTMMKGLLADRFQLKVHRETRELPVYDLMIAKNGSKLKEVSEPSQAGPGSGPPPLPPPPPPGTAPPTTAAALPSPPPGVTMGFPFAFAASGIKLRALGIFLEELLGRSVIDKTGLQGFYDLKFVFSREGIPGNGFTPPPAGAGGGAGLNASDPRPSIFTALQEELGLRLESGKGPVDVLVIDSVAKPAEN
jgi:uncharacterized protein (TIGR03435 family)